MARAYQRDPESARAEYGAEFRDGISDFANPEVVYSCTDPGVVQRDPIPGVKYSAFVDPAGGSGQDSFTLAIGHRGPDGAGILDHVAGIAPPFSPEAARLAFAATLKRYRVSKVTGDNYAAEWPKEMMRKHGIAYESSAKPKGTIYAEFLPLLNSRQVRLFDHDPMRKQLLNLERRTAWGGRDSIDHPANSHDDLINTAAGVLIKTGARRAYVMDLL